MMVKRTSLSFRRTHATLPIDASDAVNSGVLVLASYSLAQGHGLASEDYSILYTSFETHFSRMFCAFIIKIEAILVLVLTKHRKLARNELRFA